MSPDGAPTSLESEFHRAMGRIYERAKAGAGYNATRYLQMVANNGGLATARTLISTDAPSDGFVALWEANRLDLTVEAPVLEPKWVSLFTSGELAACRDRLSRYGYEHA